MYKEDLSNTYLVNGIRIGIVGASGAVGNELLKVLSTYTIKIGTLALFGSKSSVGKKIIYQNTKYTIQELTENSFKEMPLHIVFFCAGASVSAKFAHLAAKSGAIVIDNTSHFRMQENVPLIIPEVNPQDILFASQTNIIANPNCSTIQMLHILKPLSDLYDIEHVNVVTYQAVSGAGISGARELMGQMKTLSSTHPEKEKKMKFDTFKHQIALNVIPCIDVPLKSGFTKEEEKMIYESRKILKNSIKISPTCVRVPVLRSHSEALSITFKGGHEVSVEAIKGRLDSVDHVKLLDDFKSDVYPMPLISTNTDYTYVGRIRKDLFNDNMVHLFCCADQLRVGAATNAVKIALLWLSNFHHLTIYHK